MKIKKEICIVSSSFLAPNSSIWEKFSKKYHLDFSEYGDFSLLEKESKIDIIFLVIFHEDFEIYGSNPTKKINHIFELIKSHSQKLQTKLVIIYIESEYYNFFLDIKKVSARKKRIFNFKKKINKLCIDFENIFFLDIKNSFSNYGGAKCFDKRNWYSFKMRLSNFGLGVLANNIDALIECIYKPAKKVLILDCDNTLWGGFIAEDGIENLALGTDGKGQIYVDFQKRIVEIQKRGILICLCSKNNYKDVKKVFDLHPFMILKNRDITESKINWKPKYENILLLSKDLNLSTDSFVFWDDNPIEREEVKINLPDVKVIDVPTNIELWPDLLHSMNDFVKFDLTQEDKNKTEQYKARKKFLKESDNKKKLETFLKNIKAKPKVLKVDKLLSNRAAQMTQKTNQFNFRTKRFSTNELINFNKSKKNKSYLISFEDKFGSHGCVGLIMLSQKKEYEMFIDNFLMSCRILGRKLELWFLAYICKEMSIRSIRILILEFLESSKNNLLIDFIKNTFNKQTSKINFKKKKKIQIIIDTHKFSKKMKDIYD